MDINKIPKRGGVKSVLTIPGAKFAVVFRRFALTVKSETPNADGGIHVRVYGSTYPDAVPFIADDLWLYKYEGVKDTSGSYILRGVPKLMDAPSGEKGYPVLYADGRNLIYSIRGFGRPWLRLTEDDLKAWGIRYQWDDAFTVIGDYGGGSVGFLAEPPTVEPEPNPEPSPNITASISVLNSDGYNGRETANEPSSTVYGALSALETWVLPERGVKAKYKGESLGQICEIISSGDFYRYSISVLHTTKEGVDVKGQFKSAMNALAGGKGVTSKLVANPCQITLEEVDSTPTPIRSTSVTLSIAHSLPSAYLETIRTMEEQGIEFFIRVDREVACPFENGEWGSDDNRRAFEATGTQYAKRGGWTFKLDSTLSSSTGLGYNGAECVHTLTLQGSDFSALKEVMYKDKEPACVGDLLNMAGAVMNVPYTRIRKEHEYIAKTVIELGGLDDEVTLYEALEETMRALGLSLYCNGTALIVESMNCWRGNAGAEHLPWNTGREFWGLGDTEAIQPTKAFMYSFNAKEKSTEVPAPSGVLQVYTKPFVDGQRGRSRYNEKPTDDKVLEEASKNILSDYATGALGSYKWCYENGALSGDCFAWLRAYVSKKTDGEMPIGYSSMGDGDTRPVILADGRPAFYGLVPRRRGVGSHLYIKIPNLKAGCRYVVDIRLQGVLAGGYISWGSHYTPRRNGDEEKHLMLYTGKYSYSARLGVSAFSGCDLSFLQSDDETKPEDEVLDVNESHDFRIYATRYGAKELTLSVALTTKAADPRKYSKYTDATLLLTHEQIVINGKVLKAERDGRINQNWNNPEEKLRALAVHTAISGVSVNEGWEAGETKTRKTTKEEWFPSFFTVYRRTTTYTDYRTKFKSGTSGAKDEMRKSDYSRLYALTSFRGGRDEVDSESVVAIPANAEIRDDQTLMNVKIQQVLNNIKEKYSMFGAGGYAVSGRMRMDYLYSLFLTLNGDFSLLEAKDKNPWYYLGGYSLDLASGVAEVTLLVPCVSELKFLRYMEVGGLNMKQFGVKSVSSRMTDKEKLEIVRNAKSAAPAVGSGTYGSGGRRS